jgi:D-alanyl-D-alanine carboxypeptidase
MEEMRFGKRVMRNHNPLLRSYEGADGMKTGFICDSGFNLVASASRNGQKLVAVVLGEVTGGERSTRAANLLEHGFQTLGWKALFGTESLDTLPLAADAKSAVSIRQSVKAWACGTAGRRTVRAKNKNKGKRTAAAAAAKAKAGSAPAKAKASPATK